MNERGRTHRSYILGQSVIAMALGLVLLAYGRLMWGAIGMVVGALGYWFEYRS